MRPVLAQLRNTVADRLEAGETLERIEAEVVDPAPLDDERRAALWLYAYCQRPDRDGRPVDFRRN